MRQNFGLKVQTYTDKHHKSLNKLVAFHVHHQNGMAMAVFGVVYRHWSDRVDSTVTMYRYSHSPLDHQ